MNITLPANTIDTITANVSSLISDLWPVVALLLGIMLAFMVIGYIIKMLYPPEAGEKRSYPMDKYIEKYDW